VYGGLLSQEIQSMTAIGRGWLHGGYDFWIAKLNEYGVINGKMSCGSNNDTARSISRCMMADTW